MTDITDRLREWADCHEQAPSSLLNNAADEIDRLRSALKAVIPALESSLEDSIEVIGSRARDWGQRRLEQQNRMAEEYENNLAALQAARAALGE